jgi:tetratricopeptide (TPR) repeat protein
MRIPAVLAMVVAALAGIASALSPLPGDGASSTMARRETSAPESHPFQGRSLLGVNLYATPPKPEQFEKLRAALAEAEAEWNSDQRDEEKTIRYGRQLASTGDYVRAIAIFSRGLVNHPDSYRLLRHRGHRYVTLRRFDEALADLSRAAKLVEGISDELELDAPPNPDRKPRSTTQGNIYYHLALAHYLKGEFESAATWYQRCLASSTTDDSRCAASYWLYLTMRRLGRDEEAANLLQPITSDMDVQENFAYNKLLRMFKGELKAEDLLAAAAPGSVDWATIGYAAVSQKLFNGDRAGAMTLFKQIVCTENWAPFGFIGSEVELARSGEPMDVNR